MQPGATWAPTSLHRSSTTPPPPPGSLSQLWPPRVSNNSLYLLSDYFVHALCSKLCVPCHIESL